MNYKIRAIQFHLKISNIHERISIDKLDFLIIVVRFCPLNCHVILENKKDYNIN